MTMKILYGICDNWKMTEIIWIKLDMCEDFISEQMMKGDHNSGYGEDGDDENGDDGQ